MVESQQEPKQCVHVLLRLLPYPSDVSVCVFYSVCDCVCVCVCSHPLPFSLPLCLSLSPYCLIFSAMGAQWPGMPALSSIFHPL